MIDEMTTNEKKKWEKRITVELEKGERNKIKK